jgi:type I restriction-modification system DNA methylase subunit
MLDEMQVNDEQLDASDIRRLESADEVAHFFARLRYDVDARTNIPDYAVLGMGSEDMRQHIHKIELIGKDPEDGDISIYLFEVRSVTAKLRNDIARRFRERPENALLVLTKDYEALEFVMLERVLSRSQSRRAALKQAIRPIPLAVNRLHPDPIALRVLKRFTFTEEDAAYQWEKLRSAYMLAQWSEAYFNNRALFSDYYLKERLTDPKITPVWDENVRPVGRETYKHIVTARKDYTRQTADVICKGLYEPIFKLLGFDFAQQKSGASSSGKADYLLYTPGDKSKPIAAALTYVWNRNLDDVDESRERAEDDGGTPFKIPGAIVVSLLEAQVAPWVIVTNGKLWRLYSSTASNKATNYYEIDLEEAIAANDQITALKYWWLMFRQQAFTGFLDNLLKNSADYAKELGDRLKDRVFEDIFLQFARGFIADMHAKGVSDLDDAALATVFSGTMTFLYRLMFILYAESLELLPVHEVHGYREHSLYRMKREIADAGGTVLDESPDKLGKQYKTGSTKLYDRLKALFTIINQGSDELNMPTYNGGLFSQETDSGQFLATYAIPDCYLALGLDRLARDVDDRTKALVFIDFKSLGVRHLGSIYEGLLEFKLQVAGETLAVTKEKGKEVYKPAKQVKKPLATIDQGEVYLENDKQERKATGSYYTPDYIVKYIVRHTVGPVLDRKFAALEKRLRDAHRGYRKYARLVEARRKSTGRDESVAVYWNTPEMRNLVDDCLNVRVLDPAMGSGHFLVEVVDYVTNRLIDFLNGWSENPVWAFLEQTRDDILNDMERQKVTIDADRLTRVALLKRAVLKRCVYGVDLNAMAVELAKVSLWLDAFTLGAPLSFLDHHLKHGNSLMGARVADAQKALEGDLTLFSRNKFAGVMLATNLMRQVSYLSDNTIEQSRQSAQAYRDARDHLAPYKRVLDVYTSRWFGNAPIKNRKGATLDLAVEFLRRDDTQAWLEDPHNPKNCLPDDDYMQAGLVAKTALNAAEGKRFFHWELEFPEVFFAPSRPGGQDVQLRKDGGFDVVMGNPPYGMTSHIFPNNFLSDQFVSSEGRDDSYKLFIETATIFSNTNGMISYIIPNTLLTNQLDAKLPQLLISRYSIQKIITFSFDIFDDPTVHPCVVIIQKCYSLDKRMRVKSNVISPHDLESSAEFTQDTDKFLQTKYSLISIPSDVRVSVVIDKLEKCGSPLGDFMYVRQCIKTGNDDKYVKTSLDAPPEPYKPVLRGADINRYETDWCNTYVEYGDWLARNWQNKSFFEQPKIMIRETGERIAASSDFNDFYLLSTLYSVYPKERLDVHEEINFLLAVINSNVAQFYMRELVFSLTAGAFTKARGNHYERLPIPRINFTTPANERERLTQQAIGAYDIGDNPRLLQLVQADLGSHKTDVVHDLLAHLAQRMIGLNKQKQTEVKRFLKWLEERLRIQPKKDGSTGIDSLSGKTIFQGYLGDYQTGEGELPWREFYYRLYQNRNRFAVSLSDVEGEIQREYEKSLETLIPIKRNLARTDVLIDKIVYRLYGLTDEEIELIERPQYEQALADAKAQVVADDKIKDDEEKIEKIAEGILPAAKRFFERVEPKSVEEMLDSELPTWRSLPPDTPTFLLTGDYSLRTLPDHMDFSASVISYAKAVEVVLSQRIFMPFRQQYTDADCRNDFLKRFMRGEKDLTLGSFMIILSSSQETALRNFISRTIPDATNRVFGTNGLVTVLNDDAMRDIRNKAAHDEVLSRNEAQEARVWAMQILRQV